MVKDHGVSWIKNSDYDDRFIYSSLEVLYSETQIFWC